MDGVDAVIDWNGRDRARHPLGLEIDRVQNIPHRGLIGSDGWKINLSVGDRCELYDLNTDPHEQVNVFDDPANRERIRDMAERLANMAAPDGGYRPTAGRLGQPRSVVLDANLPWSPTPPIRHPRPRSGIYGARGMRLKALGDA